MYLTSLMQAIARGHFIGELLIRKLKWDIAPLCGQFCLSIGVPILSVLEAYLSVMMADCSKNIGKFIERDVIGRSTGIKNLFTITKNLDIL